jgi:DNA-binding Lrp family transcriptional regulator
VLALDHHIDSRDHTAVRRREDRGVVSGADQDAARLRQPSGEQRDQAELTELAERWTRRRVVNRDDALPFRSGTVCHVTVQAYILIQTEVGKAAAVAAEIAKIKGVTQAEDVTGPYDVIVRSEARNVDELGKLVVAKVQSVAGITRTLTCPVVHL